MERGVLWWYIPDRGDPSPLNYYSVGYYWNHKEATNQSLSSYTTTLYLLTSLHRNCIFKEITMSTIQCICYYKTFMGNHSKCNLWCHFKLYVEKSGDEHIAYYIPQQAKSLDNQLRLQPARHASHHKQYTVQPNQKSQLQYYTWKAADYLETVKQDNLVKTRLLTPITIDPCDSLYSNPY